MVDCNLQLLRRRARCRLEVTSLMSRRQIQRLRDSATSRLSNNNHDGDDDDDDASTNSSSLRMSARHIRSLSDVTDQCQLLLASKLKVGLSVSAWCNVI